MANDTYIPPSMSNTGREQESTQFRDGDEFDLHKASNHIASFEVVRLARQAAEVAISSQPPNYEVVIPFHERIGAYSQSTVDLRKSELEDNLFSEAS